MKPYQILLAGLVAAVLLNLSAAPFNLSYFSLFAFGPLLMQYRESWKRRFLGGWFAGFAMHMIAYNWIFFTVRDFGGLHPALAVGGTLLFCLFQGLDLAIWLLIWPALVSSKQRWLLPLSAAAVWLLVQRFYPYLFPWVFGANFNGLDFFREGAAFWRMEGLGFLAVMAQGYVVTTDKSLNEHPKPLVIAVCLVGLMGLGAVTKVRVPTKPLRVAVIQPNLIPLAKRGRLSALRIFNAHYKPSVNLRQQKPDLVLWPETAVNFPLNKSPNYQEKISALAKSLNASFAVGAIEVIDERYYNSVYLFNPDGAPPQIYRKERLVLFSESLPWILSWAKMFDLPLGGFYPGEDNQPLAMDGADLLPLVCFEALFSDYVADQHGHLMINLTNDAWFGETHASALHLQQIRMRTVELNIPMVRATNSGISCWIDRNGKIRQPTGLYEEATPVYTVQVPSEIPKRYSHVGGTLVNALSICFLIYGLIVQVRDRRFQRDGVPAQD